MANSVPPSLSHTVQELLARFYSPQTNNEEKHAIELKLQELQNTSFNWRISLSYMDTIDNSYLWFFAATTIERTVNFLWKNLSPADQQQLRMGLYNLYMNYPCDVPALQRDKVAKIMATIERQQCSGNDGDYGEFVNSVLGLLEDKFFLGLALVGAIGDTVTTAENIQTSIFGHIVNSFTPNIMQELNKYCGFFVMLVRGDTIQTVFDSINAERKNQYCSHLLNTIQQYFSWMKLDRVEAMLVGNISILACSWSMMRDGAIGALGALTELLYRNLTLPHDAGRQLALGVYHILSQDTLKLSDDLYQDKVCDLIRQYIKRGYPYETDNRTSLLQYLLEFTMFAKTPHALMDRINVWTYVCGSRFRDYDYFEQPLVGTKLAPDFADKLICYLKETLYFGTYPDLEMLDDEDLDENFETELNRFQNQSIELICQLLRCLEASRIEQVLLALLQNGSASPYMEGNMFFRGMIHSVQGNTHLLQRYKDERMTRDCMVDYITACNLILELARILCGKYPNVNYTMQQITIAHIQLFIELSDMLDPIIEICNTMVSFNPYIFPALAQHILQIKLYLQIDLSADGHQGTRKIGNTVPYEQKVLLLTKLPLYILHQNNVKPADWVRVTTPVVQLLNFYVSERFLGPRTCSLVFDVLRGGVMNSKLMHLNKETRTMVHHAVCKCLIMMHDDAERSPTEMMPPMLLEQYICFIGSTVMALMPTSYQTLTYNEQKQIIGTLIDELATLKHLMSSFDQETNVIRSRLASVMHRVIEKVITLFRSPLSISIWAKKDASSVRLFDELLEFCYSAVKTVQSRTDSQLLKEVVQLLKELFAAEENLGVHRLRSVLTLLNIFHQLVTESHNRSLTPDIIHIVISEVLPVVASDERYTERNESLRYEDVLNKLYEVLHELLHHRWQYFVETNPLARSDPDTRSIVQPEAFLAIMNAYGYALLSTSGYPSVVKTVLCSLDMLQLRRNLFRLPLFIEQLMDHFIKSLLKLAVSHVGNMHLEEITTVVYEMADIDPVRLKVIVCDLGMTYDLTTFHMLQNAQDFPSFRLAFKKIITEAKTHPPECKNFEFLN